MGSTEATTRKLWGGYNFRQGEYWSDAWGSANSPSGSGIPYVYLSEPVNWYEPELGMYSVA